MGQKPAKIDPAEKLALTILKNRFAELGWTVQELADRSGIPRTTVHDSIRGLRATTYRELKAIANALGFEAWELLELAEKQINQDEGYAPATYDPANQWELAAAGEHEQDADDETAMMMQEP